MSEKLVLKFYRDLYKPAFFICPLTIEMRSKVEEVIKCDCESVRIEIGGMVEYCGVNDKCPVREKIFPGYES